MALPSTPPANSSPVIRRGDIGWPVYALQTHLSYLGYVATPDGVFGPGTETMAKKFQTHFGLTADGIAGPATQSKLVVLVCHQVDQANPGLPDGLLRGQLLSEGGLLVAPVNWSVGGGVDCGPAQYRVYGPPFAFSGTPEKGMSMKVAFSPRSIEASAADILERQAIFLPREWVTGSRMRAGRLAAFAHNWPTAGGADYYAINGHVMNPDGACTWLPRDRAGNLICRFPDGVLVRSRQDWAEFYAMGGSHGEGMVTRYVTSWS